MYTDSPPDKDDLDFERHDIRTPVLTTIGQSVHPAFTIRRLPTNRR